MTPFVIQAFPSAVISICAIGLFVTCRRAPNGSKKRHFEDEDGEATSTSLEDYAAASPYWKVRLAAFTGLGINVIRFASTVLETAKSDEREWIGLVVQLGCWALLASQTLLFSGSGTSREDFITFSWIAPSALSLLASTAWEVICPLALPVKNSDQLITPNEYFEAIIQCVCCLYLCATYIRQPRRPEVLYQGQVVDGQKASSLLDRCLLSWAKPLFSLSRKTIPANFADLPALSREARASSLVFENLDLKLRLGDGCSLATAILYAYRFQTIVGWLFTTARAIVSYLPQICMYKTLSLLENRDDSSIVVWAWAIGIAIALLVQHLMGAHLLWYSMSAVQVPLRSQLSALVYQKSLRVDQYALNEQNKSSERVSNESEIGLDRSQSGAEDQSCGAQEVVNLMTADALRISEFAAKQHIFVDIVVTAAIAFGLLSRLIGWISLGIGLLAPLLLTPINILVTRRYATTQKNLLSARDAKIRVVTEVLQALRQIKFSASESKWQAAILQKRSAELREQKLTFVYTVFLRLLWISSPILLSVVALVTYAIITKSLSAAVAFTALATFGSLEHALSLLPFGIMNALDAYISCKRIEQQLRQPDRIYGLERHEATSIRMSNAAITWPGTPALSFKPTFMLRNVNVEFPSGQLSVIFGASGSGKTLLLQSLIGECIIRSGSVKLPGGRICCETMDHSTETRKNWIIPGATAWVPQTSWLESKSVRDNILFGLPLWNERYELVLESVALKKDLASFPRGDMTQVGPRGVALSGGQKARISLARALYSRAGILILDDMFSSVDANTRHHILHHALLGPISDGRTRIMSTHHYEMCVSRAQLALHVINGTAVRVDMHAQDLRLVSDPHQAGTKMSESQVIPNKRIVTPRPTQAIAHTLMPACELEDESMEQGRVKALVYKTYLAATGQWVLWPSILLVILVSQAALMGRGWPLRNTSAKTFSADVGENQPTDQQSHIAWYMSIYVGLSFGAAALEVVKCTLVYAASLRASHALFHRLTHTMLRAPLHWLDATPTGRLLNRFSADFVIVDSKLPGDLHVMLSAGCGICLVSAAGLFISGYLLMAEVILIFIGFRIALKYLVAVRIVKRLDAIAKSPIMDLYCSSLLGVATIRAFGVAESFLTTMMRLLDDQSRCSWAFWLLFQWMDLRVGIVSATLTFLMTAFILIERIDASLAGLLLVLTFGFTLGLQDLITRYANVEFAMNAAERIIEYSDIGIEHCPGTETPAHWPGKGAISIRELSIGYHGKSKDILEGISLDIASGEKVGIIGRTGAGKSTLLLAMIRALEHRHGSIVIDGVDISSISLADLRSRLSLVPQDPTLFQGTIRANLDPFQEYPETTLRASLERIWFVQSHTEANKMGKKNGHEVRTSDDCFDLDYVLTEGGLNLSQGQRQLLCLARASLRNCRIILMDEATSSLDKRTDAAVQQVIHRDFPNSTVLMVTHRTNTVCGFDKVLVIEDGRVAEFGPPDVLLRSGGAFHKMMYQPDEAEKIRTNEAGIHSRVS